VLNYDLFLNIEKVFYQFNKEELLLKEKIWWRLLTGKKLYAKQE